MRANIVKVLTSCPSGVYLTEFQQKYLEASGSQLLPRILGFENLETLLNMLVEDIVQLDYDVEDILVKLKEDKPSGVASPTVPTQDMPGDDVVDVVVGEIFHPHKFYVQLASQYDQLNQLMDLLDMFYVKDCSELSLDKCEVVEGDLVAVPWTDNMWYRGRVKEVKNLTTLSVFYLDYGSVADVKRSSVRLLASQFFYLPGQALPAQLSGVVPVEGRRWPGSTSARLLQLTRHSHELGLQAIVRGREGGKLGLWLIDRNGGGINETLVEEGLARYDREDSCLQDFLRQRDVDTERSQLVKDVMQLQREMMELSGNEDEDINLLLRRAAAQTRRIQHGQGGGGGGGQAVDGQWD